MSTSQYTYPEHKGNFGALPEELLEEITCCIPNVADLLAFALTCQQLHRIIIPARLDHSYVTANLHDVGLWHFLSANRAKAGRIRSLRITNVGKSVLSPRAEKDVRKRDTSAMKKRRERESTAQDGGHVNLDLDRAAVQMRQLRSLELFIDIMLSTPGILPSHHPGRLRPSEDALRCFTHLESVKYTIRADLRLHPPLSKLSRDAIFSPLWNFSNLREFELSIVTSGMEHIAHDPTHFDSMIEMLASRSPSLEKLRLDLTGCHIRPVFERGRWPRLVQLHIAGDFVEPGDTTNDIFFGPIETSAASLSFRAFLRAHPRLEDLSVQTGPNESDPSVIDIVRSIVDLPLLRILNGHRATVQYLDLEVAARLVECRGVSIGNVNNLICIRDRMPELRYLSGLVSYRGMADGESADSHKFGVKIPQVQRLDIQEMALIRGVNEDAKFNPWCRFLLAFINVTHLRIERVTQVVLNLWRVEEVENVVPLTESVVSRLLKELVNSALPKLEYFATREPGGEVDRYFRVRRNDRSAGYAGLAETRYAEWRR